MTRRLAIIPARSGSKRIPKKNIAPFCGVPMIGHILSTAKASELFSDIHVSTDSDEVAKVAEEFGFAPEFLRPAELSDDHAPLAPVIKYVAEHYQSAGQHFDEIWMLLACAPLIEASDLIQASEVFQANNGKKPVMFVGQYATPVERAYEMTEDRSLVPVNPGVYKTRTQDLPVKYFDAGAAYVYPPSKVLNSDGRADNEGFLGIELPKWKALDIDDQDDWALAEAIYSARFQS